MTTENAVSHATQDTPVPVVQVVEAHGPDEITVVGYRVTLDGDLVDTFATREEARTTANALRLTTSLRALADFTEAHPELPTPTAYASLHVTTRERFVALANALSGEVEYPDDKYIVVTRHFGSVRLVYQALREVVCTPRIEDGKVAWDLPPEIHADTLAAAA